MKNKFLKLDNPCSEKWKDMKPKDKGNYCDLCSKKVIDFTNNLENKDYLYFEPKFAIAIYGSKAKDGLYILTDKKLKTK
ncbi:hypothetical protein [Flavobacterium sp. WC2509]|uniref:hypothetical protein n=1 Tax=Flavobacterium sp. WC2509 TaxID=3461406 RepID=UPI004044BB8F